MNQFLNTTLNCIKLGSFKYFKMLYNEFPHKVRRTLYYNASLRFDPRFEISMGIFDTRLEKSTALLHELGHYKDFISIKNDKALSVFNNPNHMVRLEKTAWKNCFKLADKYNIELDYFAAKHWLNSYGGTYKVLENRIQCIKSEKEKNIS